MRKREGPSAGGQVITPGDIPKLLDLGKKHIYVWEPETDLIHEDDARSAPGPAFCRARSELGSNQTREGVNIRATRNGLFKVHVNRLRNVNELNNIVMATLHNNRVVTKDQVVAGTRIIPLAIERHLLEAAEEICAKPSPLLTVKPFQSLWVGVVTTGSEVYSGRIRMVLQCYPAKNRPL